MTFSRSWLKLKNNEKRVSCAISLCRNDRRLFLNRVVLSLKGIYWTYFKIKKQGPSHCLLWGSFKTPNNLSIFNKMPSRCNSISVRIRLWNSKLSCVPLCPTFWQIWAKHRCKIRVQFWNFSPSPLRHSLRIPWLCRWWSSFPWSLLFFEVVKSNFSSLIQTVITKILFNWQKDFSVEWQMQQLGDQWFPFSWRSFLITTQQLHLGQKCSWGLDTW